MTQEALLPVKARRQAGRGLPRNLRRGGYRSEPVAWPDQGWGSSHQGDDEPDAADGAGRVSRRRSRPRCRQQPDVAPDLRTGRVQLYAGRRPGGVGKMIDADDLRDLSDRASAFPPGMTIIVPAATVLALIEENESVHIGKKTEGDEDDEVLHWRRFSWSC
jgi:hypothetical protein